MKVFAYLRVSTKEQLDGGGFDRQYDSVASLCANRGWTIARTFKDQQSGGTEFSGRSGLQEIISLAGECNALGIDTVVVENASRIARDLIVQELFLAECRRKGIKVYTADTGDEIVMADADPSRVLMRQIFGALAQWEKAQTVLKLQAGRRKKAREQGFPCGGPKPYGSTVSERAVISDIMKYRGGAIKWTLRKIASKMMELGYPAPGGAGGYWHAAAVLGIVRREESRKAAELRFAMDNDS
jgi:DNA invertase Pin-like site-specific DNA recombinase